jgi:mRNA-degrading endonuclease RelE of RelBE toxin-antitoxin system
VRVTFTQAFLKQLGKLDPQVKASAKEAARNVIDFYDRRAKAQGLGVKRLRGDIWEARAGLRIRVLYLLSGDELKFLIAGTHEDVKRFLLRA